VRKAPTYALESVLSDAMSICGDLTHIATRLYIADMRYRSIAVAVAVYLATLTVLSYVVWGPWEGVDPRTFSWWVTSLVLLFHVGVGFVIGRWWAVALPLVWALLSSGAGGYDTPLGIQILFQTFFLWGPALALGVAVSKLRRGTRSS
jgi:hypothetical protein